MTEKLFYEDSYTKQFTAEVKSCEKEGEYYQVVLDRTAFFPEGGGQYADTGTLGGTDVLDVQEKNGVIYHKTTDALEIGQFVEGRIDWELRFMKMQQHTGEHIVSGLVHRRFGYNNVGFHLGSEDCTMDFNGEITKEQLLEIEYQANEAATANLDVCISYPDETALESLEYRSKIEIEGQVRIVTIPGYDVCACCAPHVKKTGEIGMIKLTNVQRYKGGVRVTMLCGFRALADYNRKAANTKLISAALCAKEDAIAEAVEKLKEECASWKLKNAELQKEILGYRAKEIPLEYKDVVLFEENLEGDGARLLMNLVLEQNRRLCAVFQGNDTDGFRYVIGSRTNDVRMLAKELNAAFEGRGGGKPEMVQGSVRGKQDEIKTWILEKARQEYS